MKILILLFSILSILPAYADNSIFTGYRDLKWNSPPIKEEMTLLEKRGDFSFYRYHGDNNIGGIPVENFACTFCKKRFCSFFGVVDGKERFISFTKLMYDIYGPPSYDRPPYGFWLNETDIFLFYDSNEQKGYFLFHYNPIFTELEIEKEKIRQEKKKSENKIEPKKRKRK